TARRLSTALDGRSRHRWRRELAAALRDVELGAQSPLELHHLRHVERAHGLPSGIRQRRSAGRSTRWIDVDLDEYCLRIELDGRLGHAEDGAFGAHRRDNDATRAGHATLRYGWADVLGAPCEVAAEVAAVLAARGWTGRPRRCGPRCPLPA